MFYKILKENQIIDVVTNPVCVCHNKNNKRLLRCDWQKAEGIVDSKGSIWYVEGWVQNPALTEKLVKLFEISYQEYEQLKEALSSEEVITHPEESVQRNTSVEKITIDLIREYTIKKMSEQCAQHIINGINVEIRGVQEHFDLTLEDQINLISLKQLVENGETLVPYHSKNGKCALYTSQEINKIVQAATQHRIYHTTYYNSLKIFISQMDMSNLERAYYGMEIPEEYQTEALKSLLK